MTKEELKDYLVEEAEYLRYVVDNMSNYSLLDAYLQYNGIVGYTDDILDCVQAIYGIELE